MPTWCVVRGCKNTSTNKGDSDLSWHSFPLHEETLLTEWLVRVKGIDEARSRHVNKHWKICSEHFEPSLIEKTLTGRRRLKKGAVPTIFDQKDIKRRRLSMELHRQKMVAAEIAFMNGESISMQPNEALVHEVSEDAIEEEKINGLKRVLKELKQAKKTHETVGSDSETGETEVSEQFRHPSANQSSVPILSERDYYEAVITKLRFENEQLRCTVSHERQLKSKSERELDKIAAESAALKKGLADEAQLRKEADEEAKRKIEILQKDAKEQLEKEIKKRIKLEQELEAVSFNFQSLSKNPKFMHYYSGFTADEFENFIDFLGRNTCEHLSFEDRGKSMCQDTTSFDKTLQRNRPGPKRSISPKDQLLMSLCRVRLGLTCQDLAIRFQSSIAQVSKISGSFITLMKKRFIEAEVWPEDDKTHIHNDQWPDILKPFHQRVRAVIVSMKSYLKNAAKFPHHTSMVANAPDQ